MAQDAERPDYTNVISALDVVASMEAVSLPQDDRPERRAELLAARNVVADQYDVLVRSNNGGYRRVLAGLALLDTADATVSASRIKLAVSWECTLPRPDNETPAAACLIVRAPTVGDWYDLLQAAEQGKRISERRRLGLRGLSPEQTKVEVRRRVVRYVLSRLHGSDIEYAVTGVDDSDGSDSERRGIVSRDDYFAYHPHGDILNEQELIGRALDTKVPAHEVAESIFAKRTHQSRALRARLAVVTVLTDAMAAAQRGR